MVPGERYLARAGQVEVVGGQVVDLVGVLAEESGASHDVGANQGGRDERHETLGERLIQRHVHEREFQSRTDTLEEIEAATRHFYAAGDIDRAEKLAEIGMVARLKIEAGGRTDLANEVPVVFAAGGNGVDRDVADGSDDPNELGLSLERPLLCVFHLGGEGLGLQYQCAFGILWSSRDRASEGILFRPKFLELLNRRPAMGIGRDRIVDEGHGGASRLLGASNRVRIIAKKLGVNHPSSLPSPYRSVIAVNNTPGEQKKRAAVVYNPIKVDLKKLRASVDAAEASHGWAKSAWFETSLKDAGQGVTASAIRRGARVVLAAGGDGTIRAVAEGLRDSGVALALLPLGTGNLLARNLELPLSDLDASVAIAFGGRNRVIDLGVVEIVREDGASEEHGFLVMAGLGLDAKMIKNTNSKLKKAVGWLAYVDGIARSLPELKPVRVNYQLDDAPSKSMKVHTILVGNCGLLPGGLLLMPEAKPDDGLLDIAALRPQGPLGWAKIWRKIAWENGVLRKSAIGRKIIDLSADVRDVTYITGKSLRITVDSPQEFQLDGDEFGEAKSIHAWVDPGALTVRVPAALA